MELEIVAGTEGYLTVSYKEHIDAIKDLFIGTACQNMNISASLITQNQDLSLDHDPASASLMLFATEKS